MSDSILVIGGGIAGIQASLDLAEAARMSCWSNARPPSAASWRFWIRTSRPWTARSASKRPRCRRWRCTRISRSFPWRRSNRLEGKPGDFTVQIRQKARYVLDTCTRCGECTTACPVVLPNEYDSGMAARKAIYTPIPQSTPGAYVVDIEHCLNDPPNYLPCNRCMQVCPPKAIDFSMQASETDLDPHGGRHYPRHRL